MEVGCYTYCDTQFTGLEQLPLPILITPEFSQWTLTRRHRQRPGIGLKVPSTVSNDELLHLLRFKQRRHPVVDR